MLEVVLNENIVQAKSGESILQLLNRHEIRIPTLCHDPRLKPVGGCRLCSVQVEGHAKLVTSCNTPVSAGMVVTTHSPEIEHFREMTLRALASRMPRDLQSGSAFRSSSNEFERWLSYYKLNEACTGERDPSRLDCSHPYLRVDMNYCISCLRCVRICDEVQGQFVWRTEGRGSSLRIVTHAGSSLGESRCVSCGACADTCPTGAIRDALQDSAVSKFVRTTCHYCGVGCEMDVGVADDRIATIRPALGSPVNKGHLCVKGRYAFQYLDAKDRVTTPLIRRDGKLSPCTWDEAYGEIVRRLKVIQQEFGGQALGMLGSARATNEENYLTQKFARVVLQTNNVDCCARVCHAPTAAAMKAILGTGAATNSFDDIESAASFLLCGANPTENHPVVGARIKQQVVNGAKLIVIDPRSTELAKLASVHLALRPGTNVALINSIAAVIVRERLYDERFVATRVAEFDEFRDFIADFAPEKIALLCGVKSEQIVTAARIYAQSKPAMCFHGLGVTEHSQGTEGVMCLVNLALLTGNLGTVGAGINPLRGQNNVQGAAIMGCEPNSLTGSAPLESSRARFATAWSAEIPDSAGFHLLQMLDAATRKQLKALWVIGYDLLFTNANYEATDEALAALDFVVVQDFVLNETAKQYASVFLPAVTGFEKDGTYMNSERRISRVRQVVSPRGESKADWRILCELAARWGQVHGFDFQSAEEIWDEVRQVWPAVAGITYKRIAGEGDNGDGGQGLQWPCTDANHLGTQVLHTESFPMGKAATLQRVSYMATAETVSNDFPLLMTTGRKLYQFNSGTMTQRTPNRQLSPADHLTIHPDDANALRIANGEMIKLISRYGQTTINAELSTDVKPGEVFATFHYPTSWVNRLTSNVRDNRVGTPEYKVTAVRVERI